MSHTLDGILGDTHCIVEVRRQIQMLSPLTIPVLILGETGTGKDLAARALHDLSGRSGNFIARNVCAIAVSLFEATLFGHERGAFTGAVSRSEGLLGLANGGTLFLDEIGDLPLEQQSTLLRVLDRPEYVRIGSTHVQSSNFRLVAATNRDLSELVAERRFRMDLLYRLVGEVVMMPSLRSRIADVPLLAKHFLSKAARSYGTLEPVLSAGATRALTEHSWPGNVRELRHVIERVTIRASGRVVTGPDVFAAIQLTHGCALTPIAPATQEIKVRAALVSNDWDTRQAAAQLGISVATIYRYMRRHGIRVPAEKGGRARGVQCILSDKQSTRSIIVDSPSAFRKVE